MPITVEVAESCQQFRDSGAWLGKTLHACIDAWAASQPGSEAVVSPRARLTYGALAEQSRQLAAGFQELGIGRGDVVSLLIPNLVEFSLIHVALSRLGAVINPLYLAFREREVTQFVNLAGSKAIIAAPSYGGFAYAGMLRTLRPQLPSVEYLVAVGAALGQATPAGFLDLRQVIERGGRAADFPDPPVSAAAPFSLFFTSGSTGEPKGVVHLHDAPLSNAAHLMRAWASDTSEVILGQPPYGFAFGAYIAYCSLVAGAKLVVLEAFTPEAYAHLVQEERVTYTFGGPTQVHMVLEQRLQERYDFSSLRKYLIGGTISPPELIREAAEKLECYPIALWGMTETYGGLHTSFGDPPEFAATSVGRPAFGNEIMIAGDQGAELPPGEVGELLCRGANLFHSYHQRPDLTRASFSSTARGDGWFHTGDLACLDEAGNVRIVSRLKDMINRGGAKVYPAEVEALLSRHPRIAQAAMVGMPDERLGERACLFVTSRDAAPLSLDEVVAFLRAQRIASYKLPERLEVIDRMPLNPAAKLDKQALRARLLPPA